MNKLVAHITLQSRQCKFWGLIVALLVTAFTASAEENFSQQVSGEGRPVILIPGLMSNGTVWNSVQETLTANYEVHVLSLAGFAGTPAAKNPSLEHTMQEIGEYIKKNQLHEPVIIGHSLGGFIGFWLAVNYGERIGKVISVDGLPYLAPVFTRSSATTVAMMQGQASMLRQQYRYFNGEQLEQQAQANISIQATAKQDQQKVLAMARHSHPETVGEAIYTLLTTDLRNDLKTVTAPILLLGAVGAFTNVSQQNAAEALYQQQLEKAPNATLIMNRESRHFIMFDQPNWLARQIIHFIED
ncbi:alpha/beta hydrolase [Alteromonas pelagimontana]|uniref:Alpha/beta hydrolase n=1 Tax=Alteromonas pelagimontana TaxID=1858656 RepID=A0A6M4MDZ5_9ALTE|nr:alpha/beta hydrolase [Alteromonas pelagimontana]QJR81329.1 alpha/beta hydrolase [Alteromonas pelagimontana]